MDLATAAEMQKMDHETIELFGFPGIVQMENAGRGATRFFMESFKGACDQKVAVIAGKGNNGGDGFVMARYLSQKGIRVSVYLLSQCAAIDGDAAANLRLLEPLGVPVIEIPDQNAFKAHATSLRHQDIWIDAILGTGLKSKVIGYFKEVIDFMNRLNKPIFAVDIPSGLNSDTGQPWGVCIKAQATATFAFAKIGHVVLPGVVYTGQLKIVNIGIPQHIAKQTAMQHVLITQNTVAELIQPRSQDAHKGDTGHVLIIAGSPGKTGAAAMSATSAMRSGAGLVTLATPKSLNPFLETRILEAMTHPLAETKAGILDETALETIMGLMAEKNCLAIGPGIGTAPETKRLIQKILLASQIAIVIDADGLNCIADNPQILRKLEIPVVLTPHPGEMARLINSTTQTVQQDRIGCARTFARQFGVHLVLKGARTVIAEPDGKIFINPTGNPGMASGGMGDVLTGIIAGFIAQGYAPGDAARAGVYLHGSAGDTLADEYGPYGFLAGDVMNQIPRQIKKLTATI